MGKGQALYKKAKKLIPGGTQLLTKRPEMFLPDLWPAYYEKAKGCEVWDLDGKKYIDMSYMGVGACTLGYADEDVNSAVDQAINKGSMCTLNAPEEVELAELLIEIHPWAQMVRYSRTGGEAMSIAVRIARAKTENDIVLFCGYHGWHDWYLSTNLADDKALDGHLISGLDSKGVPRGLLKTAIPFTYNNQQEFQVLMQKYHGKIAAVVMEPLRNSQPLAGFLETIRKQTKENGIVLVFDEITAGWRLNAGGAHLNYKIDPDIAVFAKGMSNGFPMAAIIGTKDVMEAAQETFISSTYWTDRIGPAAAIATINKYVDKNVAQHLIFIGKEVKRGWAELAEKHGLKIEVIGIDPLGHFEFKHEKALILKTLFTQLMLEKGFLATTAFYASYAHTPDQIKSYLDAVDKTFGFLAIAINNNSLEKYLKGPVCHSGFKRLT